MQQLSTQERTQRVVYLALAIILDQLVLFRLPQGGSISLGMLPLIIFARQQGLTQGFFISGLTGLIQLFLGGYFLNPLQFLLDYPLAYGMVGLAGLFPLKNQSSKLPLSLLASVSLACLGRLLAHTLAGIVFYSDYAPKGSPVWLYSLSYNASFLVPSALACYLVLLLFAKRSPALLQAKNKP